MLFCFVCYHCLWCELSACLSDKTGRQLAPQTVIAHKTRKPVLGFVPSRTLADRRLPTNPRCIKESENKWSRLRETEWTFRREVEMSGVEIRRGKGRDYKDKVTALFAISGANGSNPREPSSQSMPP